MKSLGKTEDQKEGSAGKFNVNQKTIKVTSRLYQYYLFYCVDIKKREQTRKENVSGVSDEQHCRQEQNERYGQGDSFEKNNKKFVSLGEPLMILTIEGLTARNSPIFHTCIM